jgi:hypothetical protein
VQVVRWSARSANCPRERVLFRYPTRPNTLPSPPGAGARITADASLTDRFKRYRGLELLVTEGFPRTGDLSFRVAIERDSLYRFDQRRGRYVRYATRVHSVS